MPAKINGQSIQEFRYGEKLVLEMKMGSSTIYNYWKVAEPQVFKFRKAAGQGPARITEVKGKSQVWNQLATNTKMTIIGATTTYADGYTSAVLTNENSQVRMTSGFRQKGFLPGDKILVLSCFSDYSVANSPFNLVKNNTIYINK